MDDLGLKFLEDFPICQYWMKHFGITLGIYILGMLFFRQNKTNVPSSSNFVLLVSVFIFSHQQIPDPVCSHNSVLTAVSCRSSNLHYWPTTPCRKRQLTITALMGHYSLVTPTLYGVVFCNVFATLGTIVHSVLISCIFLQNDPL